MDNWMWVLIVLFPLAGFTSTTGAARGALRTRHTRRLELLERRTAERRALEAAARPPEPICGCTHHLAKHDKHGKCHETVEVPTAWDADRKPTSYKPGTCNCQQYIGPQPLTTLYAEDITDI